MRVNLASRLAGAALRHRGIAVAALMPLVLGACVSDGPAVETTGSIAPDPAPAAVIAPTTISGDPKIDQLIETYADENNVPRELAFAVVRVESRYNPKARGRGVFGLSQIQPSTARSLGFSGAVTALLDPETNLRYGMKYLAGAWEKGDHDVCRTAMMYKAGHRATHMSHATLEYCSAVKQHMAAIERRRMSQEILDASLERRDGRVLGKPAQESREASMLLPAAMKLPAAPAAAVPAAQYEPAPAIRAAAQSGLAEKGGRLHVLPVPAERPAAQPPAAEDVPMAFAASGAASALATVASSKQGRVVAVAAFSSAEGR